MNPLMTIAAAVLCVVPVVAVILALARLSNAVDEVNARD